MFWETTHLKYIKEGQLDFLRREKRPILLYGAGSYAKTVADDLRLHGIQLAGAFVDDPYLPYVQKSVSFPVFGFSERKKRFPHSVIVMASLTHTEEMKRRLFADGESEPVLSYFAPFGCEELPETFLMQHRKEIEYACGLLEDSFSKTVFEQIVKTKLTGNSQYMQGIVSQNQYFDSGVVQFGPNETFVDGGAYTGDTIENFIRATDGTYNRIYAFEPDPHSFRQLEKTVETRAIPNARLFNKGLWNQRDEIRFNVSDSPVQNKISANGSVHVSVDSIDRLIPEEPVTSIKLDVEGAERKALEGARQTITRDKPKLMVCVYHRQDDLFLLPALMKKLNPAYKLYLRQYTDFPWETVCYAL